VTMEPAGIGLLLILSRSGAPVGAVYDRAFELRGHRPRLQ
jgi:hypothetical protein